MDAGGVVHISWLQAILLGLLQGFTEFLPVSSTAHMDIAPQLMGMPDPGAAFSAIAQLGPIVAIVAYFRNDLSRYVKGVMRTRTPANLTPSDVDARLGWFTLIGTIPLVIAGLGLEKFIDKQFRALDIVAICLFVLALIMAVAEATAKLTVTLEKMTFQQSFIIGLAQALAVIPGTSRSGVTITMGLFQGLEREDAARFSFLLSIPAITLAGLYKLAKVVLKTHLGAEAGPYVLAAIVAGVFAYVVIKWFLGYMKEHNTGIFIIYRIALGVAILFLVHTGRVKSKTTVEPPTAPVSKFVRVVTPNTASIVPPEFSRI